MYADSAIDFIYFFICVHLRHLRPNWFDYSNAVDSSIPCIKLKFCTAAPDAPFTRLSIALITTTRPRTERTVISQKFVPETCFVEGSTAVARTNRSLA